MNESKSDGVAPHEGDGMSTPRQNTLRRREDIVTYLSALGQQATLAEMAERFRVSESTIRRDLGALSDERRLWKVPGGALAGRAIEPSWREKQTLHAHGKAQIGRFVVENFIHSGDVVLIDAGTSAAAVARLLAHRTDVTVVVAGVSALVELVDAEVEVVVVGGKLRRPNASFFGAAADSILDLITPSISIIGCDHLDVCHGVNCPDFDQATFKTRIMQRSQRSLVLADESKLIGMSRFSFWAPLIAATGVVTTAPKTEEAATVIGSFRESGHSIFSVSL